ncbi:GNAT family N-acetyltransferase [Crenobacter cavernae]|nr:GNAT family N-acetyltransferase [Crenobacter cavernae]
MSTQSPRSDPRIGLRTMQEADLEAVLAVQRHCYRPELIESRHALASRRRLAPDTCWVAERADTLLGYLFAHPWAGEKPPALDTPLAGLPAGADTLFIHDLALHPDARGHGVGPKLVDEALRVARARGLVYSRLVAVQGADAFWARFGYRAYRLPTSKLACYGDDALGMQRAL